MSADTPSPEPVQDFAVHLKPIFGVEPKYYLAVIYGLILLGIVFAVTILPGLTNPGTQVTITSSPPGAAVSYGTKHFGTTPLSVFFPEGQAALTVSRPGFQPITKTYASGNNLFLSLFLPKTDSVDLKLSPVTQDGIGELCRTEVGRWALTVPFTGDYRFPPLFTRFTADAKAAGWDQEKIKTFLLGLRPAVADPQMYADYGQALGLWPTVDQEPGNLEAQYKLWVPLVGSSDRLALWLLANQPKPIRDRETAEPSDWLQARISAFQASLKLSTSQPGSAPGAIRTPVGSFHGVSGTSFLWGSTGTSFSLPTDPPFQLPVPVTTSVFWVADREVTQSEFTAFITANPKWALAGKEALMADGLADSDYLAGWNEGKSGTSDSPMVSVSWYAAQAYVQWVNNSGKVSGGKKAALPNDYQWEAAARAPGATLLNQGVWEWTNSEWYPGDSLVLDGQPVDFKTQTYARSLKGGIQGAKGSVKAGDRAGWPAAGATPGLGFRLILVGAP